MTGMTEPMRSITLQQPWAWAVIFGGKTVENRRWGTTPGPLAIHAGTSFDRPGSVGHSALRESWARAVSGLDPEWHRMTLDHPILAQQAGRIIGVVDIADVHFCDTTRGCYFDADVLGWMPYDGSDASEPGWRPRFCSPWGDAPPPPRGKEQRLRHFTLVKPRVLDGGMPFTGHQGIRRLPPEVEDSIRLRLSLQSH